MKVRNIAASVRTKLLNKARAQQQDFNHILTRYALERLLYRLSISVHADKFLLKGALLFDLWFDVPHRPTRDIDLLGFGLAELPYLIVAFEEICAVDVDDGMWFDAKTIRAKEIRKQANYQGIRVTLLGWLDGTRSSVQIDIGYGDAVTPAPEIADYPILLEIFPAPRLRVYSRYTVIAEKLETMIFLGIANSRMKDYFDLWVLSQHADFDGTVLRQAIAATLIRRSTAAPAALPFALTTAFAADPSKRRQWEGFLNKNRLQAPALEQVVSELHGFLGPILESLSAETEFKRQWDGESGWRV